MSDPHALQRQEVFFSGHVQGVGFRFTTRQLAESFAVTGFVQNMPDGRVRMMVEGEGDELDRFVGEIQRRMGRFIGETQVDRLPGLGEFDIFEIRRG